MKTAENGKLFLSPRQSRRNSLWDWDVCAGRGAGLVQAAANVGLEGALQVLVDEGTIEPLGIEVTAAPALDLGMFGIVGSGHDGQEALVAALQ